MSYDKLQDMFNELKDSKEFFTYKRDHTGTSSIFTLLGNYKVEQDFQVFINEFERESGLDACKLDDFKDVEISKFVRQGTHFNETVDLVDTLDEDGHICYTGEYKHIDPEKAYIKYRNCKYYQARVSGEKIPILEEPTRSLVSGYIG